MLDLTGPGAALSGLRVGSPEGKEKEEENEIGKGGARKDRGGGHERTEDAGFSKKPSESTPGATDHPDLPSTSSPTTTTLPSTKPATSSPTASAPLPEGIALSGVPYHTYGVDPPATAASMAHPVSEPMTFGSSHTRIREPTPCDDLDAFRAVSTAVPLPTMPAHTMPEDGVTSLSGLGGLESCVGRSRRSRRSSDRSLTRSEIRKALCGATAHLIGDLTEDIRAKLEPLIPPQVSPMTAEASRHQVEANHLVADLTHTLGAVRSRSMTTPAAIPRSFFVPRTAQPPYSHVEIWMQIRSKFILNPPNLAQGFSIADSGHNLAHKSPNCKFGANLQATAVKPSLQRRCQINNFETFVFTIPQQP